MTATNAIDNDVVLKLTYFGLLDEFLEELEARGNGAVLGTAKFVLGPRIAKDGITTDPVTAQARLNDFLAVVEQLEPDANELVLATQLEDFALRNQLELDSGESLLCSIVVHRSMGRLITGDKRAIRAIESLVDQVSHMDSLLSNVACLEQVIVSFCRRMDLAKLRSAVCSAKMADAALSSCFCCHSPEVELDLTGLLEAVTSFVDHLRLDAATVLVNGLDAWDS